MRPREIKWFAQNYKQSLLVAELQWEHKPPKKSITVSQYFGGNIFFNYNKLFCHIKYLYKEELSLTYLQVESLLGFRSELVISECTTFFSHSLSHLRLASLLLQLLPSCLPEGRDINPTPSSLVAPSVSPSPSLLMYPEHGNSQALGFVVAGWFGHYHTASKAIELKFES